MKTYKFKADKIAMIKGGVVVMGEVAEVVINCLKINLTASEIGWKIPKGPTIEGPKLLWVDAIKQLS